MEPAVARGSDGGVRATYLATVAVLVAAVVAPEDAEAAGRKSRRSSVTAPARTKTKKATKEKAAKSGKAAKSRSGKRTVDRVASNDRRHGGAREDDEPQRTPRAGVLTPLARIIHCPADMVAVAGRVCVDRFELRLIDTQSSAAWSPFFPPDPVRARGIVAFYDELRDKESEPWLGALLPIPRVPTTFPDRATFKAISEAGVVPQGHLTADEAEGACRASGKRLCSESEWLTACRGDGGTDFPYGTSYRQGACNVYRESHPSWLLHGNAARYHDDPRNNLVATDEGPLLRKTGATPACASRWGDDAIYDMVGNLDEWVADAHGVFAGGFYSRPNKSGCFARVSNHPRAYSDYSTGARCCADPFVDG